MTSWIFSNGSIMLRAELHAASKKRRIIVLCVLLSKRHLLSYMKIKKAIYIHEIMAG